MYETYKNLKKLSRLYDGQEHLDDVATHYQQTQCPITFSYAFDRVWSISLSVANKFWGLTDEEKVSIVTEELHKALMDYQVANVATVQNFYSTYLKRRFYAETKLLQMDKRKANAVTTSYHDAPELLEGKLDNNLEVTELTLSLQGQELSEREQTYCQIVASSTGNIIKDSDVAKLMGISASAINQMRKRLAIKLQPLLQLH